MSTIVVTPPQAAPIVPVSNVSLASVPPKGNSKWVCTSIPPGITYLPAASITWSTPSSVKYPGPPRAAIVSPSISTSLACTPVADTTLPFLIRILLTSRSSRPLRSRQRSGHPSDQDAAEILGLFGDQVFVGVGAAVAVEGPAVADLLDLVEVEVAHDQLRLVGVADVADELALGVDEVALAVEVVVADVGLDADAVDGADVVHVGDGGRRLLDPPDVLGEPATGRRRVEHDAG